MVRKKKDQENIIPALLNVKPARNRAPRHRSNKPAGKSAKSDEPTNPNDAGSGGDLTYASKYLRADGPTRTALNMHLNRVGFDVHRFAYTEEEQGMSPLAPYVQRRI